MSTPAATIRRYKSILDSLMLFVHEAEAGREYDNDREYTNEELLQVTPNHVLKWMLLRMFGSTDVGVISDATRPMVRANTLQFWKNQFHSLCLTVCRPGVLGEVRVIRLNARR
jgi:hypothetical protein